ncbi:MAG: DNA repair protein RadA [Clostridiales bacterium]|nr:DNA repair protein RadA [Clostridiales bacterium]
MAVSKTLFYCSECGNESRKWVGKCPACDSWNTLVEQPAPSKKAAKASHFTQSTPIRFKDISKQETMRKKTAIDEFDRTLGGGLVEGSLVLIGGDPGIGKSTLLLQAIDKLALVDNKALYVSGEESVKQIAMRAERIGVNNDNILVLCETDIDSVVEHIHKVQPSVVVVDSIQTMYQSDMSSAPGSVSQVRACAAILMQVAKTTGYPIFLVGHVTKSGAIAGPMVLEHMVDTVLYFEGDANHAYRMLRTQKNRFGSTNEIGMFTMLETGMEQVKNPSMMLLETRSYDTIGSCVGISMEGTRPVLVEIQALLSKTAFAAPRRQASGIDYNKMVLLLAVLEKKIGMQIYDQDVYVNVAGGLKVIEPAIDLALMLSVASSIKNRALSIDAAVFGEVGLTGEVRPVGRADLRVNEAIRCGFKKIIMPKRNVKDIKVSSEVKLIGVDTLNQALENAF